VYFKGKFTATEQDQIGEAIENFCSVGLTCLYSQAD